MQKYFLFAAALLVLFIILRSRRAGDRSDAADDRPAPARDRAEDGDAVTLRELGKLSDLRQVHQVEFFLYLPTESAAREVAGTLAARGFSAEVRPGAKGPAWLCFAVKPMVPELAELRRLRGEFEELTGRLGGEYDGWGSPVVR